jgi:rare lipoprotein A
VKKRYLFFLLFAFFSSCCPWYVYNRWIKKTFYGYASWYGRAFHGKPTASGERFNMFKLTAAHRTLPFGTIVLVTNLENGRRVVVRINDRGPFVDQKKRIIDLSYKAAKKIGLVKTGVAKVRVDVLKFGSGQK